MPTMTSRERFLTALRRGVPDRVPVAPDISNYIPAKRTGLPFWDIYFQGEPPLWKEYLKAMDHFGGDYWVASCCGLPAVWDSSPRITRTVKDRYDAQMDAMIRSATIQTPDGELTSEDICFRADPPSPTRKPLKDPERDWKAFRWTLQSRPVALDMQAFNDIRSECDKRQAAFGVGIGYPGFQGWLGAADGGLETLTYMLADHPEMLDEWYEADFDRSDKLMSLVLPAKPDYILFGGSGTLSLASPALALKYCIPGLKKWTQQAQDAGVATLLHSCGKSRLLVDMLAEHTSLGMINPLEVAPMGDVDLAEVKAARGRQIGLMGNLHTTAVMLRGNPELVRRKSLEAMRDAGAGGAFCLSTGDQCGRETPDANLFAHIDAARRYGAYDPDGRLPLVEQALAEPAPA
jgi:uroporphyrinogen decarboxylase